MLMSKQDKCLINIALLLNFFLLKNYITFYKKWHLIIIFNIHETTQKIGYHYNPIKIACLQLLAYIYIFFFVYFSFSPHSDSVCLWHSHFHNKLFIQLIFVCCQTSFFFFFLFRGLCEWERWGKNETPPCVYVHAITISLSYDPADKFCVYSFDFER
jgi:hypothetical protein